MPREAHSPKARAGWYSKAMPVKQIAAKTAPCLYCGKFCTPRGVFEHERHACKLSPHRKKRVFGKKKCTVCGEMYHAAGLRSHMATQHPLEFAQEKARRKPLSRSAQRREMLARAEASRAKKHERSTSPKSAGERTEYATGRHLKHPHATSPPKAAPKPTEPRNSSKQAQSNKQSHKQSNKPTVDRTSDSATRRAWAEMQQKMSKAATK